MRTVLSSSHVADAGVGYEVPVKSVMLFVVQSTLISAFVVGPVVLYNFK
jgi:hypothetical protein